MSLALFLWLLEQTLARGLPCKRDDGDMSVDPEFEKLVKLHYRDLYRFGFSLTRSEADAISSRVSSQKVNWAGVRKHSFGLSH